MNTIKSVMASVVAVALACGVSFTVTAKPVASDAPSTPASKTAPAISPDAAPAFTPPAADSIPNDAFGRLVRKGQDILLHTTRYAGKYVGNDMNCVSCHKIGRAHV